MGVSLKKNQELIYRGMLLKRGAGKGHGEQGNEKMGTKPNSEP